MRLDKIDLNLFVIFDAIYRERNVTNAATQLNLTQPAVSNALSRLRQTFDDPLFVRTPQGMMPTPVADGVVRDIRKALVLLGKSVGENAKFSPAVSEKVFKLGMNDLAEALLLPTLHLLMREFAPNSAITNYYVAREVATEELKSGAIDVLLDAPAVNAKSLQHIPLATLPYVVAMRSGHPLAQGVFSLDDYLKAEHVHVSSRRKGRGHMDIDLHSLGHRRNISMRVQNYLVAARVTEKTDLLWTVPEALVTSLPLIYRPSPFPIEPLIWKLYWSESAENDPSNLWLRDMLKRAVEDVLPPSTLG